MKLLFMSSLLFCLAFKKSLLDVSWGLIFFWRSTWYISYDTVTIIGNTFHAINQYSETNAHEYHNNKL